MASLKSLNKNDVVEVRALQRPPDGVRLVIEAVSIMKGVKPKRVAGEKVPKSLQILFSSGRMVMLSETDFNVITCGDSQMHYPADKCMAAHMQNSTLHLSSTNVFEIH